MVQIDRSRVTLREQQRQVGEIDTERAVLLEKKNNIIWVEQMVKMFNCIKSLFLQNNVSKG